MEDTLSCFTVGTKPMIRYVGFACLAAAALCVGLYFWAARMFPGEKWLELLLAVLMTVLAVEGISVLVLFQRSQLKVSGEHIFFVSNGRTGSFRVRDVAFVMCSPKQERTLYGQNGQVLVRLTRNMNNLPLLDQYFRAYHVPIRNL
ncbi:hypothetical protein D1641_10385 [Colidextribacter sp. OB.20]|uniref:hypothetical protein n=1 Tax=Colidextribacter sp. OB.20 TaxID=2304568 RepID=UPI001369EC19|nr:hypothetical protein [Colidextribacter sp. OB.20]NBI10414.1 hypothetical protein [Colidextribacter sp. OB.20]